jgi:hypothetical protein
VHFRTGWALQMAQRLSVLTVNTDIHLLSVPIGPLTGTHNFDCRASGKFFFRRMLPTRAAISERLQHSPAMCLISSLFAILACILV